LQKKEDKKPEAVQIKTGLENTLNIEVVGGLAEGDKVVIPTIKMIEELQAKFERRHRGPVSPFQKKE
jgi:hypothetical protein